MIVTDTGHCWITFNNGYTISIFNGYGSYTENHFKREVIDKTRVESDTCEVAVLYGAMFVTRSFIDDLDDDVKGYVTPDELVDLIYKVKNKVINNEE